MNIQEQNRADQINNNSAPFVTGKLAWFVDYRMMVILESHVVECSMVSFMHNDYRS